MRWISFTTAALVLMLTGTSSAQGFIQFNSQKDFFAVSFPGEPTVRDTTWTSEQSVALPARVYSVENKRGRYSMTVGRLQGRGKAERRTGAYGLPAEQG